MKKIIQLFCLSVLVFAMAGCGSKEPSTLGEAVKDTKSAVKDGVKEVNEAVKEATK